MVVIFTASTEKGSQKHTETIVRPPAQFIKPTITESEFQQVHFDVRKAAHFSEYAILAILLCRAVRVEPKLAKWGPFAQIALPILVSAAYASTDEWHQHFVRSRTPSIRDVFIDTGGAVIGIVVFYVFLRFWKKRKTSEVCQSGN